MASLPAPPVALSQVGRAAHDLGLAGLLGGNLFGRLALHPSVTAISDERERGKLVNAAWRRYGTINSLSLLAVAARLGGARAAEAEDGRLSPPERRLARAKDVLVGVVALTGVATAVEGMRFSRGARAARCRCATATTPPAAPRPARARASGGSTRSARRAWSPRRHWWASTPRSIRRTSAARRRGGSRCGAEAPQRCADHASPCRRRP